MRACVRECVHFSHPYLIHIKDITKWLGLPTNLSLALLRKGRRYSEDTEKVEMRNERGDEKRAREGRYEENEIQPDNTGCKVTQLKVSDLDVFHGARED